jgi:hypothetical protein
MFTHLEEDLLEGRCLGAALLTSCSHIVFLVLITALVINAVRMVAAFNRREDARELRETRRLELHPLVIRVRYVQSQHLHSAVKIVNSSHEIKVDFLPVGSVLLGPALPGGRDSFLSAWRRQRAGVALGRLRMKNGLLEATNRKYDKLPLWRQSWAVCVGG